MLLVQLLDARWSHLLQCPHAVSACSSSLLLELSPLPSLWFYWRVAISTSWGIRWPVIVPYPSKRGGDGLNRANKHLFPCCCYSVAQLCPTLWDPLDCSTPGFLSFAVSRSLLKLMSIESVMPSNHLIPFSSCLQSFPVSGSSPMSWLFASDGQSIRASASASVLPMNSQDWFPLRLTDLISLLSKGLSRVSSNTIFQKHQFSGAQLCL